MNVSGVIFSPLEPKKQRSQKKKTPDLILAYTWPHLSRKVASAIQGMDQHAVIRSFQIKSNQSLPLKRVRLITARTKRCDFSRVRVTRSSYLLLFFKNNNWLRNEMVHCCYLRPYLDIESVSCCMLLQMARVDMDWNAKQSGQPFQVLMPCSRQQRPPWGQKKVAVVERF